jgi:hypothetical protein
MIMRIASITTRALVVAALLAGLATPALGQQPPSQYRSVTDVRPRIPDEHDRPYFRETQTHRGWEIREPQYTVFADTSADDAKWGAAQAAQGWQHASELASRFTTAHHNPDFGLSALQVVITSAPLRDRNAPLTTVSVVGIQTEVQINVAPGQPKLQDQVARLREGAAFAMLHTAGVDSAVPPWVVAGLAAVAGRAGLTDAELKPDAAVDQAARFGGQQWRYARATEDTLGYPRLDKEEAASRMTFLLKGDDAEHAPLLFAALQQATASAGQAAAEGKGFASLPGDPQLSPIAAVDQLMVHLAGNYAAWKANPRAGEPIFEPASSASPGLVAAQREMVLLLKLQRRLVTASTKSSAAPGGGPVTTTIDHGPLRTKVTTFDRAKGMASTEPVKRAAAPLSFTALATRLTATPPAEWATLDVDGSLLLSSDTTRIQSLLATSSYRYAFENDADRTVLVRRLEDGTTVRGWLQDNPQDKSRPIAKFEVVRIEAKGKTIALPQAERQAERLLR